MLCALIMAGGKGTRFWPLSTDKKPKQFLNLLGKDTMIQMTVKRIQDFIPIERIFIVTGINYVHLVKDQLPTLPEENIIIEPCGRNTAACIALSAFHIDRMYKDSTIAVLPADHLIKDETAFKKTLNVAYEFINNNSNAIVTLGMKPNRAETGYGYINFGVINSIIDDHEIMSVNKFVEKPDEEMAKKYLRDGHYLWNGGMFIWKAKTILNLTERYLNNTFKTLNEIVNSDKKNYNILREKYESIESISIDYGIMEKVKEIYVIPSDFGWDDVGTWYSVERYRDKDINGNICLGNIKNIDGRNSIVVGNKKPIVLVGLSNMFVVESDEVILVGNKENIDNIKEIRDKIV